MKKFLFVLLGMSLIAPLFAAETNAPAPDAEASYTKAIEGRADDAVKALALSDTNKAAAVHGIVMDQYRALRAWHDENDAKLKATKDTNAVAEINASLRTLHNGFIAKLSDHLTPDQVVVIKDKMTYGVVQVTVNAYNKLYPDLTAQEKEQILVWLVEARELAMDQGSSNEKHAVFGKFKGRINNYLSKAGYDAKTGKKKTDAPSAATNTNSVPK